MLRKFLGLVTVLILSMSLVHAKADSYHSLDDGTYRLYVPSSYDAATPAPLMLALHPTASSGHAMAIMTGFDDYAEEMGMIVAYPQAKDDLWNEGDPRFDETRDDVAFINAIVEDIQANYTIDEDHVILSGFGDGGLMAIRLACESAETFDTIAIVGAMIWGYHHDNCPDSGAATNLILFRGSLDHFYTAETHNYTSLFGGESLPILGIEDNLNFWSDRFACEDHSTPAEGIILYENCADGKQVAYYEMIGARQNWLRTDDNLKLNQYGFDTSQVLLDFALDKEAWKSAGQPIIESDTARSYSFYVPSTYDESNPAPVVVVLHGRFGIGAGTAAHIQINPLAEQEGFIGVYPDGTVYPNPQVPYDTGWNYVRAIPFMTDRDEPDDSIFITDLIDDLAQDLNIDRDRIYVTGISNGGLMVQRLACDVPEVFAGFASVAGAGFGGMDTVCNQDVPVNMLIMHGTLDNNVQWNGNGTELENGRTFYMTLPIPNTMSFWAEKMKCIGGVEREDVDIPESDAEAGLVIMQATGCQDDAELVLYAIINGGHNWPGIGDGIPSQVGGLVNTDVKATQIIWDFFKSHSKQSLD